MQQPWEQDEEDDIKALIEEVEKTLQSTSSELAPAVQPLSKEERSRKQKRAQEVAEKKKKMEEMKSKASPREPVELHECIDELTSTTSLQQTVLGSSKSLSPQTSTVSLPNIQSLVRLQQLDGKWLLDSDLAKLFGISLDNMRESMASALSGTSEVVSCYWATCLAIVMFERLFASKVDEWTLLVKKARKWLKDQEPSIAPVKNEVATERAKKFLASNSSLFSNL